MRRFVRWRASCQHGRSQVTRCVPLREAAARHHDRLPQSPPIGCAKLSQSMQPTAAYQRGRRRLGILECTAQNEICLHDTSRQRRYISRSQGFHRTRGYGARRRKPTGNWSCRSALSLELLNGAAAGCEEPLATTGRKLQLQRAWATCRRRRKCRSHETIFGCIPCHSKRAAHVH